MQWFKEALETRWPGLLEVNWEPFPATGEYIVIPIIGVAFHKRRRLDGSAECRYIFENGPLAHLANHMDWWSVEPERDFQARWVVREIRPGRPAARRFDCVTDEHEYVEPGDRVLEAIAMRDGADERVADGIVAADEFEEVAEGQYANRRQVEARRDIDTTSHDLWMDVADQAAGVETVYMYTPPERRSGFGKNGFVVRDKRGSRE
jgi:hypothetical protein